MTTALLGLAAWLTLALPAAVLVGRAIRHADQANQR